MKIHLLNLLFLISLLSFSQSIVISGVVFDETEKDPLIGVNIISGDIGTTTDIDGKYNLELNNGKHQISFHYIGYEIFSIDIDLVAPECIARGLITFENKFFFKMSLPLLAMSFLTVLVIFIIFKRIVMGNGDTSKRKEKIHRVISKKY